MQEIHGAQIEKGLPEGSRKKNRKYKGSDV
jgi:hypothetical protein